MSLAESYKGAFTGVLGDAIVRVVYSDETGTGSEKDEPNTVVTAILFNMDSQWVQVAADLDAISYTLEFKGRQLYRDLRSGRHEDVAANTLRKILAIPARHRFPIFYGAINRAEFRDVILTGPRLEDPMLRIPPNSLSAAFDHCFERIDTYAHTLLPGEQILWIADQSQYERIVKEGHVWFDRMKQTDPDLFGYPRSDIEPHRSHIADTIYFANSRESRALQLVDVCCSTISLKLQGHIVGSQYYELIRKQVVNDGVPPTCF